MRIFLPRDTTFINFLNNSTKNLKDITKILVDLAKDYKNFSIYDQKAKKVEHDADQNTHDTVKWLNKTFILPFDREDILLLTLELDDIIDLIENLIHNINLYKVTRKPVELTRFCHLITRDTTLLGELLVYLVDARKNYSAQELIVGIHELEDQGDVLYDQAIARLVRSKDQTAVSLLKNKVIVDNLEEIMDKYQKVSDVIQGILVKFS